MKRKTWVVAGAAVLAAVIGTSGVVLTSAAKTARSAAPEPPTDTVKVEKRTLSAMVSLDGTLTYQAQSDGSPYSVINQDPRDIHRPAAARTGDLSGSGALPGQRQPGGVALWLDT